MAVTEIDIDQFAEVLTAGARVIDVREPDEYEAGHVPGAVLIPLGTVPEHLDAFLGDGPTYVICQAGGRSRRACELVDAGGLDGVRTVNVAGGTGAWIASGRETVVGDQP
ncbi:MAG: rhodanese-like domain-containing protein [Ilumatobacteraceae bacterium]